MVMVEALKGLSPSGPADSPAVSPSSTLDKTSVLELPVFTRGKTWPRLPCLPPAHQFTRPPRYVSDLLINLFFEQLHFTLPVVYKPHFLLRYNLLVNSKSSDKPDTGFLSVFFAVLACASALLPTDSDGSSPFAGFKFYESAISLFYGSTGEGSIEQVQCLALLSMCAAGWNTVAQGWKFAGQAVRAAQDLGLHVSTLVIKCNLEQVVVDLTEL